MLLLIVTGAGTSYTITLLKVRLLSRTVANRFVASRPKHTSFVAAGMLPPSQSAPSLQDGVQPLNRAAEGASPGARETLPLRLQQANTSLQTARREMEESLARAAHAYAARLATLDRWGADGLAASRRLCLPSEFSINT